MTQAIGASIVSTRFLMRYSPDLLLATLVTTILPNSAGSIKLVATWTVGFWRIGCSGTSSTTPRAIIAIVTIEETLTAMAETVSPRSVPSGESVISIALRAQGIFILPTLPVMKVM